MKTDTECKAPKTRGPKPGWTCLSRICKSKLRGKGEETRWGSLRLVITSVLWGVEESRALQLWRDQSSAVGLNTRKSGIMLKEKNPWAQPRLTGVCTWAEVCHRCVFFCAPSRVFPPRISDEEWQLSPSGRSALRKQMPSSPLRRRGPQLCTVQSEAKNINSCQDIKPQAQIKTGSNLSC